MPLPRTLLTTVSQRRASRSSPASAGTFGQTTASLTPRAVCFPRDDVRFAERVQGLVDTAGPHGPITAAVQALLRDEYPLAVISPRHPLAAVDGGWVWYVFREGSLVPIVEETTS
jgi:hypothetical protein